MDIKKVAAMFGFANVIDLDGEKILPAILEVFGSESNWDEWCELNMPEDLMDDNYDLVEFVKLFKATMENNDE